MVGISGGNEKSNSEPIMALSSSMCHVALANSEGRLGFSSSIVGSAGSEGKSEKIVDSMSSMFVLDPGSTEGSAGETGRRLYPKSALADSLTMGVNGVLF